MKRTVVEPPAGSNGVSIHGPLIELGTVAGQARFLARAEQGDASLILEIADEWRAMCAGGPYDQPFFRPEWIHAVVNAFAATGTLILITIREEGRLRAVLPLLQERRRFVGIPIIRLRSATNSDYSCRFDIIHDDAHDHDEVIVAVWQCLQTLPEWDVIELSNIPAGGSTERLMGLARENLFRVWQQEFARSPYIALTPPGRNADFTRFVRSANLRSKLRRHWRKLQELGNVRLRRVERADDDVLERFYALERSGWKGKSGTAIACLPQVTRFYDLVAAAATRFNYFSLYFLEISGRAVAGHFGLTLAGRYFPLKIAYDESYSAYSPGHLLVGLILQDAAERGLSVCECLGDSEDWKMRWLAEVRPHSVCYIHKNHVLGNVLHLQTLFKHRLRKAIRRAGKPVAAAIRACIPHRPTDPQQCGPVEPQ